MSYARVWTFLAIAGLLALVLMLDLQQYLTLENLRAQQGSLRDIVDRNLPIAGASFFAIYVAVATLNIPGAAIMTLAAGAVFPFWAAVVVVSFASSIGATFAFVLSRFLLRDYVEKRFESAIRRINSGVERDGGYYLFTLRLVPVFPFFVINMVMALTRLRTPTFYWVSQLGMLPATLVYVNAGTQLGAIDDPADILSPAVIGSFLLLGIFPLLAKKSLELVNNARSH